MQGSRDAETVQLRRHQMGAARRVREENQFLFRRVQLPQRIDNAGEDRNPVMYDTPEIEYETVVVSSDFAQSLQNRHTHGRSPAVNGVEGGSWLRRGSLNK